MRAIQEYCARYPRHQPLAVANKYKGPYNSRKCTANGYAEFSDKDARNQFLKDAAPEFEVKGAKVKVKPGKTQWNSQRDFFLYKALDLVKEAAAEGTTASVNKNKRTVEVDGATVFTQQKEETGGTFSSAFGHLALP